jgi:imidazolonepropionase
LAQSILLRGARQLLTLRGKPGVRRGSEFGNLAIIEDGSVFIQGGKIVSVGPTRRIENLKEIRDALDIPVHNCIVMPGFVDPAIRLSLAATDNRGRLKRRKLSDFYEESIILMRSCLQHGTLNAGIKACAGIRSLGADLAVLRQLVRIGNSPVGLTRIWHPDTAFPGMPASEPLTEAIYTITRRNLAHAFELRTNPDNSLSDPCVLAANKAQLALSLDWLGGSAAGLQDALVRSAPVSVFCRPNLSPEACDVLAQSTSIAVFKAGGALLDNEPDNSLRTLADAGGAIALGSGYDAQYEPNYNLQLVLALAVRRLRLTIEEAIVATTINAAYVLNCGDQLGSLEPGKRADVLVLNLSDYREIPRRLGVNHVAMAIRDGNLAINRTRWRAGAA